MTTSPAAGKTVVVTGAGGGLGKVLASALLDAGANVAVCDVNETRLKETATEWEAKHDASKFIATIANITDEASVTKFFSDVSAKFGRVDMLINNAGIMDKFDAAGTTDLDLWNQVINVNLTGAFLCTKAAVNVFEAQTPVGGTIINIASIAALRGLNAGAAYTVSKHGLLGLMRNTAGFYGPKGIYSVAFLMGAMETNIFEKAMAEGFNQEGMGKMMEANPGQTMLNLPDVASYCVFLSDSNMAKLVNGSTISLSNNWPSQ
ncbi:NAD(P)-binding protein [Xylariaceae sp. FL1019]|nr:NAD(P)-binding protein [Xylariaceae sp. FL1019]